MLRSRISAVLPQISLDASTIYSAFNVSILDTPGNPAADALPPLQIGIRAQALGVTHQSALDAWVMAQLLLASPIVASATPISNVVFNGSTASSLNQLLASVQNAYVRVTSASLSLDQPIQGFRTGVTLDLGSVSLSPANPQAYMVRIVSASNVTVTGGIFTAGNSAVLVSNSNNVVVKGSAGLGPERRWCRSNHVKPCTGHA